MGLGDSSSEGRNGFRFFELLGVLFSNLCICFRTSKKLF